MDDKYPRSRKELYDRLLNNTITNSSTNGDVGRIKRFLRGEIKIHRKSILKCKYCHSRFLYISTYRDKGGFAGKELIERYKICLGDNCNMIYFGWFFPSICKLSDLCNLN